jgi:hypothetical protein
LDIEENQVRFLSLNGRDGRLSVAALGYDFEIGFLFQQAPQALAR